MSEKYQFDARRYCFNNKNRLGHLPDGTPCADMIICELDSRAVLIEALKRDRDNLRAELAALKAAARPFKQWERTCGHHFGAFDNVMREDSDIVTAAQLDELARLCGEDK